MIQNKSTKSSTLSIPISKTKLSIKSKDSESTLDTQSKAHLSDQGCDELLINDAEEQVQSQPPSENNMVQFGKKAIKRVTDVFSHQRTSQFFDKIVPANFKESEFYQSIKKKKKTETLPMSEEFKNRYFEKKFSEQMPNQADKIVDTSKIIKRQQIVMNQYEKAYGITNARAVFLLKDEENFLKIPDFLMKKLPIYQQLPIPENLKENMGLYIEEGKTFYCLGGELYQSLFKAFQKCLQTQEDQEVDMSVLVGGCEHIDLCCKVKYKVESREIIVKLRRVKSLNIHKNEKEIIRQFEKRSQNIISNGKFAYCVIKCWMKGTQVLQNNTVTWKYENDQEVNDQILIAKLYTIYNKMLSAQEDLIEFIDYNGDKCILTCEQGCMPCILNPTKKQKYTFKIVREDSQIFWDYVDTFKTSIQEGLGKKGQKSFIKSLKADYYEHQYVSYKWASTLLGEDPHQSTIGNSIEKLANIGMLLQENSIKSIQKVFNSEQFKLFKQELANVMIKYPTHKINDLVQHMFVSSSEVTVKDICQSDCDIASSFANKLIVCNNSKLANKTPFAGKECKQVILALVLICPSNECKKKGSDKGSPKLNSKINQNDLSFTENYNYLNQKISIYPGYIINYN